MARCCQISEHPFFGVSLKMYFGYAQTVDWCERVHGDGPPAPSIG